MTEQEAPGRISRDEVLGLLTRLADERTNDSALSNVDDTDARVITEQLGELTSLNLSACQVGDAGARAIAGSFVLKVVERLAQVLGRDRVFYDQWYEARLLGRGGDLKLQAFYEQAEMIVPFFSEHYGKKWCAMEWETIRGILLDRRADDAVIPVHLDDTSSL